MFSGRMITRSTEDFSVETVRLQETLRRKNFRIILRNKKYTGKIKL